MKRILIAGIIAFGLMLIHSHKEGLRVRAIYQNPYCRPVEIKNVDEKIKSDYWDYTVSKEGPNFVLDYFQDPAETGVDITMHIQTAKLEATYFYQEDICTPYNSVQEGKKTCTPSGKRERDYYYYLESQCVPYTETTYRTIETGSVSVWLEPTQETREVLGPGPFYKGTLTPVLRYLYPDQWALLIVNPGDMTIVERPWFRNSEDVVEFLKKNKDYVILESDAKEYELTSRLAKMQSPMTQRGALALMYMGNCWAEISKINHKVCFPSEGAPFRYGVIDYTVQMKRIPLDVPGTWYIGVSFYLWPAKFDNGRGVEDIGTGEYRRFVFSDELMENRFSFESYILRSAPCNPDEPGGCWNAAEEGGE